MTTRGKGKTTGLAIRLFILKLIAVNAKQTGFNGVHCNFPLVWAGNLSFNKLVSAEFGIDTQAVRAVTDAMTDTGEIVRLPAKGGVRFYLPDKAPASSPATVSANALTVATKLLQAQ